jgi:hypothetical protein
MPRGSSSRRSRKDSRPPPTLGARLVAGAIALFGLVTASLAFIALWEIVPLFGGWPGPPLLPLSGYYEWLTFKNLKPDPSGRVPIDRVNAAEAATRHELRLSPMATDAWLRLAYIQTLRTPGLNAVGIDALEKSFVVAPLDPVYCGDRDILALNHWPELTQDLRTKVLTEIKVTWRPPTVVHPEVIEQWRSQVHNPSGQFALALTLGAPHAP